MTSPFEHLFYERLFYHKTVSGNETKIRFVLDANHLYDQGKSPQSIGHRSRSSMNKQLAHWRIAVWIGVVILSLTAAPAIPVRSAAFETGLCSPALKPMDAGTTDHTIESGGMQRRYLLHVPPGYDPAKRTALVFSLHGFISTPAQQMLFSRFDKVADAHGFIVVFPQGTGNPLRWNAYFSPLANERGADDVQFMRDLIAALSGDLCIDPARIYVNGLSNGGGMSDRIACEMADQVAAIGSVAGAYAPVFSRCKPVRPVPVIAFHGTADPLVPYEGRKDGIMPPIKDWAAAWASRNGCDPVPVIIPAKGDASGIHYQKCISNADVILYTIDGGGHTWPGGFPIPLVGKTSKDIDASEVMWQFFDEHPLPPKAVK
jgi:polyhydroxybutyrate depolymerase